MALACSIFLCVGSGVAKAQVMAVVYGEPITALDVSQRAKLNQLAGGGKAPTSPKEVLEELIDDKLKVREATRFGITASDSEVEETFAQMAGRMRLKPDQLAEQMSRSGTSANTIKSRVKADLVWQRLVRGRFSSTLSVGERDVLAAVQSKSLNERDTDSNTEAAVNENTAYEYSLTPILMVAPEGAGSGLIESRKRDAQTLRNSFKTCATGIPATRTMRDVAIRDKIVRNSSEMPAALRKILDGTPIGQLTPPEVTKYGVEMFAVCEKVQVQSDSPQKREAREALFAQRFDAQSKRYLQQLRRSAMVEYK